MPIERVCPQCFGAMGLRRRMEKIRPNFPNEPCSLHESRKGIPIGDVAKIVDGVFRDNFGIGHYNPHLDTGVGNDLQDTLISLTEAGDYQTVDALVKALEDSDDYWPGDGEDPFYSTELTYVPSDHALETHSHLWDRFCQQIVFEQRFFNTEARKAIEEIFSKVHLLRDVSGRPPIYTLEPGTPEAFFYRGRIANDDKTRTDIHQDTAGHLGPPPQRLRRGGRMNAAGISAFYGAFEERTAIAELRPAVGSVIAVAQFTLLQPVNVLDMTRFTLPGKLTDMFSEDHVRRVAQYRFMQRFTEEIKKPVFATEEHLDYLPTQAVAEYLVHRHHYFAKGEERPLDGIIYSSAQTPNGRNIVLLGDAALAKGEPQTFKTRLSGGGFSPKSERLGIVPKSLAFHYVQEASFGAIPYSYVPPSKFSFASRDAPEF